MREELKGEARELLSRLSTKVLGQLPDMVTEGLDSAQLARAFGPLAAGGRLAGHGVVELLERADEAGQETRAAVPREWGVHGPRPEAWQGPPPRLAPWGAGCPDPSQRKNRRQRLVLRGKRAGQAGRGRPPRSTSGHRRRPANHTMPGEDPGKPSWGGGVGRPQIRASGQPGRGFGDARACTRNCTSTARGEGETKHWVSAGRQTLGRSTSPWKTPCLPI